jgi:hypothetical protein
MENFSLVNILLKGFAYFCSKNSASSFIISDTNSVAVIRVVNIMVLTCINCDVANEASKYRGLKLIWSVAEA